MNIHEYQAKELLARYGVPVPPGKEARSAEEARAAAEALGGQGPFVLKAQVHAGGRGRAGGIRFARDAGEVRGIAAEMLGMKLVTHQTGPRGKIVRRILVEQASEIAREHYVGLVLDRRSRRLTLMACAEGGVEIEEVAAANPAAILVEPIDPLVGLLSFQARKLAAGLALPREAQGGFGKLLSGLCRLAVEKDCSLVEVNPLVLTKAGATVALDAKVTFDDNALFRHADVAGLRDTDEEDPTELEASRAGLSYVRLAGNIGCMVNGAGLAMATMDMIQLLGGRPANFLDVGGGANIERTRAAFRLLLSDPAVSAILVNIFGGILRCDTIAGGIVQASRDQAIGIPVVVRLQGTNADLGRKILAESGQRLESAAGMREAVEKVVAAAARVEAAAAPD